MKLSDAQREFNIRYYHWASSQFEREIGESFPILRMFKYGPIWEAHQFMQQIDKSEQLILAKSVVRRSYPNTANILGERLSDGENSLLNRFDNFRSRFHGQVRVDSSGQIIKYVSKNKLRKAIEIAFIKAYGDRCVKILTTDKGWEPFFEMKFAGWIVTTSFSFDRRQSMISYQHSIVSEAKVAIQEYPPECWPPAQRLWRSLLLGVLGIIGQTQWVSVRNGDVDQACDAFTKCSGHFFDAVPQLLKGLEFKSITEDGNLHAQS